MEELNVDGTQDFRPSEFMRARRPELFSDTKIVGEPQLTREVFEYHLDTLTSRKQEIEFEYFTRRLAEKELCPNLIPQTGPMGGGDSKVDTETYPVSDEIALRWYEGIGSQASQERWAFAISAKKEWRPKLKSDVKKIASTDRDYKLIYFITNQFVRDRSRAETEDELNKQYSINIRILDRSWIIKSIFENERIPLAIETLNLTGYDDTSRRIVGPKDTKRESELLELEQQIENPSRYKSVEYQLAEDCLRAALLARGLELPRVEVDGRFLRAKRVAERVNNKQQRLRITYNRAWTAFWWYDDFDELNRLYDQVEEFVLGTLQATDLELLANLWQLIHATIMRGNLEVDHTKFVKRTKKLRAELDRLELDDRRPNNSLQARTNRLLIDLSESIANQTNLDTVLKNFKKILVECEGLAEFPLISITQIILELGEFLADSTEYDELFEVVVRITQSRASEGEAGVALLHRGYQKIQAGKKFDAIRVLGRAQQKLAMREYHMEWVASLASCGVAYEAVGLLWAARANMLLAANHALSEYWKHGTLVPQTLLFLQKLIWLELQLGRVPYVLAWIETASLFAGRLLLDDEKKDAFYKERDAQDLVFGLLLLKTDVWDLKRIGLLPQVLDEVELYSTRMALLYALGYEDFLQMEGVIPENKTSETIRNLFARWLFQPANYDLPDHPEFLLESKIKLYSFVLGCKITIEATNDVTSISLAETLLGVLEAFLATSLDSQLMPYRSELRITIHPSDFSKGLPEYQVDEASYGDMMYIKHASIIPTRTPEERKKFRTWLQDLVLEITMQIAVVNDPDSFAKRIIRDELGLGRALNLSEIDIALENILGRDIKFRISDWVSHEEHKHFALRRDQSWYVGLDEKDTDNIKQQPLKFGEGEPADDLFGIDNLKHKDRRILSLINIPLWDKAGWQATVYIYPPDSIPFLILGFNNSDAAKLIFEELKDKLGRVDDDEKLRVSIITGIDKKKPSSYKVLISTNPILMQKVQGTHAILVFRIHRLDPPDLVNLNSFLEQYNRTKKYAIGPAQLISETELPEPFWDLMIVKQELTVRPAWQICENDPDVCAIQEGDDPIIPSSVQDAPIVKTLQRFAKRKKRRRRKRS